MRPRGDARPLTRAATARYDACMDLDAAVKLLRACVPGLSLVYLHGSHARGDARADSDVDVAVLADSSVDPLTLVALQSDLEPLLGADVDLLDLGRADDVIRVQVIAHGRVLFERSTLVRERFEMHALSRYAHLNEERSGIIEDVSERGSVHG